MQAIVDPPVISAPAKSLLFDLLATIDSAIVQAGEIRDGRIEVGITESRVQRFSGVDLTGEILELARLRDRIAGMVEAECGVSVDEF